MAKIEHEQTTGDEENSPNKRIKLTDSVNEVDKSDKIQRQLEYYFSDVNIVKDKFLLEQIKKGNGWVNITTLLTFARLKELTRDLDEVVHILEKKGSDILEIDEEKKRVRRKIDIPDEDYKKSLDLRTVHLSGFPTDYTFEDLNNFCKQFGDVESVMMRRHFRTKSFKGNIHVVFKREEDAKNILATEPFMCKDRELKKESMTAYYKRKQEFYQQRQEKRKNGAHEIPKKKDDKTVEDIESKDKEVKKEKEDKVEKESVSENKNEDEEKKDIKKEPKDD